MAHTTGHRTMTTLYITPGSPYARIARIVVLEKNLADHVQIIPAQTRATDSPYYQIAPSGRVPYLVRDDGPALEESSLICAWLDHMDGRPMFEPPSGEAGWEARRLEAMARSLMDGASVWLRELRRPAPERSAGLIAHETSRAGRICDVWEREIAHPLMHAPLNMAQITLACALGLEARIPEFRWRPGRPALADWFVRLSARPSVAATVPV
jgi:glutathione S-transferase